MAKRSAPPAKPPGSLPEDLLLADIEYAMAKNGTVSSDKWALFDKRFDYAWKYFQHHAQQRYTAFNFFVVFAGILATAYGTLFKEDEFLMAAFMSVIATGISAAFLFLDRRNEELVVIAEDVLRELERDVLFKGYRRPIKWPGRRTLWGRRLAGEKPIERQLGLQLREESDMSKIGESPWRHGRLMPLIQLVIALCFLAGAGVAGYAHWQEKNDQTQGEQESVSCALDAEANTIACKLIPDKKP